MCAAAANPDFLMHYLCQALNSTFYWYFALQMAYFSTKTITSDSYRTITFDRTAAAHSLFSR